eukprot:1151514-Prorocentrum_minimum.AAC.1
MVHNGFNGTEFFPDFPWREDGLLIWAALVDYVKDYVGLYYSSDEDVAEDKELQDWYREALTIGHSKLFPAVRPRL